MVVFDFKCAFFGYTNTTQIERHENVETEFNPEFITRMLPRLEWPTIIQGATAVSRSRHIPFDWAVFGGNRWWTSYYNNNNKFNFARSLPTADRPGQYAPGWTDRQPQIRRRRAIPKESAPRADGSGRDWGRAGVPGNGPPVPNHERHPEHAAERGWSLKLPFTHRIVYNIRNDNWFVYFRTTEYMTVLSGVLAADFYLHREHSLFDFSVVQSGVFI